MGESEVKANGGRQRIKLGAVCALQNRDRQLRESPQIKTADEARNNHFKRFSRIFSHHERAAEMPGYNDYCCAIRLRLSAIDKWPMLHLSIGKDVLTLI
jgi:hypothetical protein